MKPLLAWLALALAGFGGLSTFTHLDRASRPEKVLVALDSSYGMAAREAGLDRALASLGARYSRYLIVDALSVLKPWSESPALAAKPAFFGDPDYAALRSEADRVAAREGATKVVFIVAGPAPAELAGREVVELQ